MNRWGAVALALVLGVTGTLGAETLVDRDGDQVVRIRVFQDGALVWDVAFADGLPRTETLYQDGRPVETATLGFAGRDLVRRTVSDASGAMVYTDTLFRWPDGTLRRLERDGPDGPLAGASWSYGSDGRVVSAWTSEGATAHREWSYRTDATQETLVDDTGVVLDRVTEWLDAGRSRETVTLPASSTVTVTQTDANGRPAVETVTVKDAVVRTRSWVYDADGRVASVSTVTPGGSETWVYQYDGATARGRLERSGIVVREETRVSGVLAETRYYDRGSLVLVETWSGGKKTKETYYSKGTVVRERTP